MGEPTDPKRLDQLTTLWLIVRQAHQPDPEAARQAQRSLLERYSGAIRRYLLGALSDPDDAADVFQEFCVRLLRGDLAGARPAAGRFRDFVKTILVRLVIDHQRRRRRRPLSLAPDALQAVLAAPPQESPAAEEHLFLERWREELMQHTWQALEKLEGSTGQPCHTILRFRTDHPTLSAAEMAEEIGRRLGKTYTTEGVRQALHRARDRFADLLLEEVARTLVDPGGEALVDELLALGLLSYCRAALSRRGRAA